MCTLFLPWLLILQVHLANMSSLGDVEPVETQIGSNRDADQENQDKESDHELDNLPVQGRRGQCLGHLLDIWFQQAQ